FSSRRRHTRCLSDWSSDVCSSDLEAFPDAEYYLAHNVRDIHREAVAGFGGPQPADKPTIEIKRGDLDKGFREAEIIVEGRYETQIGRASCRERVKSAVSLCA